MTKYVSLNKKMEQFDRRWNITTSDSNEEAFRKFKQRILTAFRDIENKLTANSITKFCQYYAINEKYSCDFHDSRISKNIINQIRGESRLIELYRVIELVLSLEFNDELDDVCYQPRYRLETIEYVKEAIELSDVNVAIGESDSYMILYPKGEKKLDDELVNKTLSFLNEESNKHFEDALKFYQSKNSVKSAESLRRSLEEFLRYKLQNQKGLKENITFLQKEIKNGSNSEVRNIIFKTCDYLDKYFNAHSKHQDGKIDEAENEFLIYQIGLLMRYINKIISV